MITSRGNWINSSYWMRTGCKGFTLLELIIVMVIVAIGVALAVPSYQDTLQKRRLTNAAESIASFLSLAQGEAIKRNKTVAISITRDGETTWCAGAMIKTPDTADHCDCTKKEIADASDSDYCDFAPLPGDIPLPKLINEVGFESFTVQTARTVADTRIPEDDFNFNFDPVRGIKVDDLGLADAVIHDFTLVSSNEKYSLKVDMDVTGRIRVCNPVLTKKVPGFRPC